MDGWSCVDQTVVVPCGRRRRILVYGFPRVIWTPNGGSPPATDKWFCEVRLCFLARTFAPPSQREPATATSKQRGEDAASSSQHADCSSASPILEAVPWRRCACRDSVFPPRTTPPLAIINLQFQLISSALFQLVFFRRVLVQALQAFFCLSQARLKRS